MLMMIIFGRRTELDSMRERLLSVRRALYDAVVNVYRVSPASFLIYLKIAKLIVCRYQAIGQSSRQHAAYSGT